MSRSNASSRRVRRDFRHARIRNRVTGTSDRPRLCVFRSNRHMTASLIDDESGRSIASLTTCSAAFRSAEEKRETKTQMAARLGKMMGELAVEKGILRVVFDRGGYRYHGRVKALADSAREAGLRF